jgi:hypothetical protein
MTHDITDQQLQDLLKEWQGRLRLRDWNLAIRWGSPVETDGAFGATRCNRRLKEGRIIIVPVELLAQDVLGDPDYEVTICHELLHLHAELFDDDLTPLQKEHLETMIECAAQAMVHAKHLNDPVCPV